MGISSLLLVFQNKMCHIIRTWKNTPKVSPIISHFLGVGDDYGYENKLN
jgi:hypothetical protein